MKFNTEKTEEVIFSAKWVELFHPPLSFGNDDVVRKSEHKHLGMILFGNPGLTKIANRMIMEATISYIKATKRFEWSTFQK